MNAAQRQTVRAVEGQRARWSGAKFPTADAATLARLSRYPVSSLSTGALFAVAMADHADHVRYARSKQLPAAE